jgi:RNA polymerase sigma factor (sigma-70 family)
VIPTSTADLEQALLYAADQGSILKLFHLQTQSVALLSSEEEIQLALRIQAGRCAQEELNSPPNLTPSRNAELEHLIQDGIAARDHFFSANLGLVVYVAKHYQDNGLPFIDLIQEGAIGLLRAIEKFDPHLSNRFSTYAVYWITQCITRSIDNHGKTIRLPVNAGEKVRLIKKARAALHQELNRDVGIDELAAHLGWDEKQVALLLQMDAQPASLDESVKSSSDPSLMIDLIPDTEHPDMQEIIEETQLRDELSVALDQLPAKQNFVLRMRFGIDNGVPCTLKEIGDHLNISGEAVRNHQNSALKTLRTLLNRVDIEFDSEFDRAEV